MDKKEAKQKLFEIIKKEQDCTITEDDVKLLCEIVVNNNPYATEDLNIPLKFDYKSDNGLAGCATKTAFENIYINYNPNFISSVVKDIVVESNGEKSTWSHFLIDIIITSFHESRHYTQREILEQSFDSKEIKTEIEKNEKAKDIIDSVAKEDPKFTDDTFVKSLVNTLKIYYPFNDINNNPTQNINDIVGIITHGAYLNTGCEQDARNFSYLYAKEFLTAIHKDPETPDYVKKWCKESAETQRPAGNGYLAVHCRPYEEDV
jgi:hypothetical protein